MNGKAAAGGIDHAAEKPPQHLLASLLQVVSIKNLPSQSQHGNERVARRLSGREDTFNLQQLAGLGFPPINQSIRESAVEVWLSHEKKHTPACSQVVDFTSLVRAQHLRYRR